MKRGFLSVFGTAALLLGMSISLCTDAPADDSLNDLQKHVENLRVQQQGGAKAETQRIFDRARAEAQAVGAKLQQTTPKEHISPESDIKRTHVRATGGVPFPKLEEVVLEPQPTIAIPASKGMSENIQERPFKKPPRCESPEVKREEWPLDDDKEERIVGDVLYIAEELMPVDSMEVFGSKVEVYTYGPKSGDGVNIRMTLDAAPCVPYRIRVTNRARYYHKGNLALKNYDKQPGGGGQYHSWIQQKLFFGK
jgi:hypothetical protein